LASVPFPYSIPLVAAVGALGVQQVDIIKSTPIPEAEKGRRVQGSSKGTLVRVGEIINLK